MDKTKADPLNKKRTDLLIQAASSGWAAVQPASFVSFFPAGVTAF